MNTTCYSVRTVLTCAAVAFLMGCAAQKPALQAGAPIDVKKPASIAQLAANPTAFVGQKVRLEGTVSSVCKGSGCWVEVQSKDGSTMLAKSMDHSILVPTDCEGRKIVVQGVMTEMRPDPAQEAAHEKHAEGEAPHECPQPTYLVATSGVALF